MASVSLATASTRRFRAGASPRKPRRPLSPGRWGNRERRAYGRRFRRGTSPHNASPPMPGCAAPVAWKLIRTRDQSRSGSGHGSRMTKPRKFFIPWLLLRVALLTIALAVISSGATAHALAQDEDAEIDLEADLDRVAHETAELRELPPLGDID